jgi:hypothetical protein
MSYDLNIICVNQRKPIVKMPDGISIIAEFQNEQADLYPNVSGIIN